MTRVTKEYLLNKYQIWPRTWRPVQAHHISSGTVKWYLSFNLCPSATHSSPVFPQSLVLRNPKEMKNGPTPRMSSWSTQNKIQGSSCIVCRLSNLIPWHPSPYPSGCRTSAFKKNYVFIWLHQVLIVACRTFAVSSSIFSMQCSGSLVVAYDFSSSATRA